MLEVGTRIKCHGTRDWIELRNELEADGYELQFLPMCTIEIVGNSEVKEEEDGSRENKERF